MGIIIFNGISSKDFGIEVEHPPNYEFPEKDYEVVHVPGKNGDVLIDMGSYKNVSRTYSVAVGSMEEQFSYMANRLSEWLHSASGYARLEDTYDPEYYRLAMYVQSGAIDNIWSHAGRSTIEFNCKPQRFLKIGEESIIFSGAGTVKNPTSFAALPKMIVKGNGSGSLAIGDYSITISSIGGSITIDSDIQDAYNGAENHNSDISLSKGFPKLLSGENTISFSGGITSVEVIPRWWTL